MTKQNCKTNKVPSFDEENLSLSEVARLYGLDPEGLEFLVCKYRNVPLIVAISDLTAEEKASLYRVKSRNRAECSSLRSRRIRENMAKVR